MKRFAVVLLPLMPACSHTYDPPPPMSFERAVTPRWEKVGSCLSTAFNPDYQAEYQPVAAENRARLFVYRPATAATPKPAPLVIEIKAGSVDTLVGFQNPPDGPSPVTERAKQAIARCGEAA